MQPDANSLARTRAILNPIFAEVFATDTLGSLKDAITALVRAETTLTLAAVARLPGAAGAKALMVTGTNVVLFGGLSRDTISAVTELQLEGRVRLVPTVPLIYAMEGVAPALPLAVPGRAYRTEHWLPTVLVAGPTILTPEIHGEHDN